MIEGPCAELAEKLALMEEALQETEHKCSEEMYT